MRCLESYRLRLSENFIIHYHQLLLSSTWFNPRWAVLVGVVVVVLLILLVLVLVLVVLLTRIFPF
jgi:hypothetical protein